MYVSAVQIRPRISSSAVAALGERRDLVPMSILDGMVLAIPMHSKPNADAVT
jgi:hypothetical protein